MQRDDIHGEPLAPQEVQAFLLRTGGKNPYGEPKYRLVHTSNRYTRQGGVWKKWHASATLQERGGMVQDLDTGLFVPSHCQPESIVTEVREVKKYVNDGFEGWILERWMPASFYGSPHEWASHHVPGRPDIPFLGPYPREGDYEPCTPARPEILSLSEMRAAIEYQSHCDDQVLRGDIDQIVKDRAYEAEREYEAKMEQERLETEYRVRDLLSPWTHASLAAGRWRQGLADRAGVREHAGN